ncbi:MAG: hypothetical protein ACO39T_09255 [Flavobacteriaceae bacterium]
MFQQLLNAVSGGLKELKTGASKSAEASRRAAIYDPDLPKGVPQEIEYNPSILKIRGRYHDELRGLGVSLKETPTQAVGAFGARLLTDLTNDGTRGIYWRYNHPLALLEKGAEKAIGKNAYQQLGPTKTGLITASVVVPATALAGAYDITNVSEMFRPKGFSQAYAEEGSEDRRETSQPVPELFERFFLGRTGRPLNYETAKADIPSLTPERYGNYLSNYYQDKGFLGLVKATPENLQGVPEARMLGYPITIPSVTTAVGGITGAAAAIRTAPLVKNSFKRGLAGAAGGSIAGAMLGNLANAALAAKPVENQLPTTAQYEMMQ